MSTVMLYTNIVYQIADLPLWIRIQISMNAVCVKYGCLTEGGGRGEGSGWLVGRDALSYHIYRGAMPNFSISTNYLFAHLKSL